jgi:hypothetical protein
MTLTPDDRVVADLRSWLSDQGFVVLTDTYDIDHFGNQVVELARPIAVRLVRDRSEWGIFIAGTDGVWSPPADVIQAITGSRAPVVSAMERPMRCAPSYPRSSTEPPTTVRTT